MRFLPAAKDELHDRQNIIIPTSGVQYIREAIMTVRKDDISRCPSCGLQVIAEEIPTHQCRHRVIDYKIEGNILWLYDGVNWYPRKLLSISRSLNNTHFSTPKHDTPEDDRTIIIIITTYLFN